MRNPRYSESSPYRSHKHHEVLEAFRYLRFVNEFALDADPASMDAVRAIVREAAASKEVAEFLKDDDFTRRFEMGLQKLQYTSRDNVRLMKMLDEVGVTELVRGVGEPLRVPLGDAPDGATGKPLGERLVVWHGTKGYKQAWSIARGGPFITTYSSPQGVFTSVKPDIAREYLGGSDALMKITLSPEAREGVDLVRQGTDVIILQRRRAIESVEKPLTAVELAGKLQGALAQGTTEDIDRFWDELRRRAGNGVVGRRAALRASAGVVGTGRLPDHHEREFVDGLKRAIWKTIPFSAWPVVDLSDYLAGGARAEHVVEITDFLWNGHMREEVFRLLLLNERFPGSLLDHPEALSGLLDRLSMLENPRQTYYVAFQKILSDPAVERMPAWFLQTTLDQSERALERVVGQGDVLMLLETGKLYEDLAEALERRATGGRQVSTRLREGAAKVREAGWAAYWAMPDNDRLRFVEFVGGAVLSTTLTDFRKRVVASDPHPQIRQRAWMQLGGSETWKALVTDVFPREKNPFVQDYVVMQAIHRYAQFKNRGDLNTLVVLVRTARSHRVLYPFVKIVVGGGAILPHEARAPLRQVVEERLRAEGLTLEDFKARYGPLNRPTLVDKVSRFASKADPSEAPGWVAPQDRLRRSVGRVIRDEVKGAGTFAVAYLAKESFSAAVSGDGRKIAAAVREMGHPMFWASLGVFSGASQLADLGLRRLPGRMRVFTRAWVPLAAGMAAMQGLSGRFSGSELAWSTGTFLVVGTAVDVAARALVGSGGWWLTVAKLAATLYGAEKVEALLRSEESPEGVVQKVGQLQFEVGR
ncbi:MAG: hypothetical protein HYY16_08670 [Planctomycetes bacterium]|nr:hypothetical protein [Planctomycetota bacterium]